GRSGAPPAGADEITALRAAPRRLHHRLGNRQRRLPTGHGRMEGPPCDPAGVEGTISQAVRVTVLRRTRYRDLPATRLGHVFAATARNLIRIGRRLTGTPLGGTRTSHLETVMLAV
ncbi:hypothetical protein ACFWNT_46025, partial [Streptomyces sp. NPDC058409]